MDLFNDGALILEVQKYPLIYDPRDPRHKNPAMIQKAWKAIANGTHLSVEMCEARWRNIRHRFASERRHHTGDYGYQGKWPFYSQCEFLDKVVRTRRSHRSLLQSMVAGSSSCSPEMEYEDVGAEETITINGDPFIEPESEPEPEQPPEDQRVDIKIIDNVTKQEKKMSKSMAVTFDQLTNCFDNGLNNLNKAKPDALELTHEDYAFGRAIALSLANITSKKSKAKLKSEIMKIIADYIED